MAVLGFHGGGQLLTGGGGVWRWGGRHHFGGSTRNSTHWRCARGHCVWGGASVVWGADGAGAGWGRGAGARAVFDHPSTGARVGGPRPGYQKRRWCGVRGVVCVVWCAWWCGVRGGVVCVVVARPYAWRERRWGGAGVRQAAPIFSHFFAHASPVIRSMTPLPIFSSSPPPLSPH